MGGFFNTPLRAVLRRIRAIGVAAVVVGVVIVTVADPSGAADVPEGFIEETVASDISGSPTGFAFAPDGRIFVADKAGTVHIVDGGVVNPTPFIDLTAEVNNTNDRGLLGIAIHPEFPAQPYVYLLYTYDPPETASETGNAGPNGQGHRVSRLIRVNADPATGYSTAVPGSEFILAGTNSTWANIGDPFSSQSNLSAGWTCFVDGTPYGTPIQDCIPADGLSHSIGSVRFGPDGSLFFGNGDAASYSAVDERALRTFDLDSMTGKIFRIDPITGQGLSDNPFYDGDPDSNRSKVYDYGLRNPFRFTIDPVTGEPWIGDVGWGTWEEVNNGEGANFGWPCYEGGDGTSLQQGGYAPFALCQVEYANPTATPATEAWNRSGTGGAALSGPRFEASGFPAEYDGAVFYGDYVQSWIKYLTFDQFGNATANDFVTGLIGFVDLQQGPDGDLYYLSIVTQSLVKIRWDGGSVVPDVSYEYYEGSWSALPDFDSLTPVDTGVVSTFTISPRLQDDDFAFRFQGCLDVPSAGTYTFTTTSDDGSQLFIDGALVVDNDGLHAATSESGSLFLPAGWTPITVTMFELGGQEVLTVEWEGPGMGRQGIGSSYLAPCAGPLTGPDLDFGSVPNGSSSELNLQLDNPGPEWVEISQITISGPEAAMFSHTFTGPAVISPGGTLAVPVTFAPTADGPATASLDVDYNAADAPLVIALTGDASNASPTATITSPADGTFYDVGDTVSFTGVGSDPEDGPLTGASLEWEVITHHNTHTHTDYFSGTGESGSFAYQDHDDDTYLELCLTVTDSLGAQDVDCVDLLPNEVVYTFESIPSGLDLTYNGTTLATPFNVTTAVGGVRTITAPLSQGGYDFVAWSIGGDASQNITIGASPATLVATYQDTGGGQPSYEELVVADGASGYWRLGETAGTTAADAVGSRDAGYIGGPDLAATGLVAGTDTAAALDGIDDYVALPRLNGAPATAVTWELWFSAADVSTRQVLFDQGVTSRGYGAYLEDGSVQVGAWNTRSGWGPLWLDAPVTSGEAHHLVLVVDSDAGTFEAFLDGVSIGSLGGAGTPANPGTSAEFGARTGSFRFADGSTVSGTGDWLTGTVDELALYPTALSSSAVAAHYSAGVGTLVGTPPTVSLASPIPGEVVAGTVTIAVVAGDAEDPAGSLTVEASVNGSWIPLTYNGGTGRYETTWDTTAVPDGPADVGARATDADDNTTTVPSITVTVDNLPDPPDPYDAKIIADGAVAYWRLGETSGTEAGDDVGGRTGTYVGGPVLGLPGLIADPDASVGFDGVDDVVTVPRLRSTDVGVATTLELWFSVDDAGPRQVLADLGITGRGVVAYVEAGELIAGAWDTRSGWDPVWVTAPISAGSIHHVVVVVDPGSGTLELFVDGSSVGTTSGVDTLVPGVSSLALGASDRGTQFVTGAFAGQGYFLGGQLDEVALYHSALTPTQVFDHYQIGSGATAQGPWPIVVWQAMGITTL